MIPWEWVLVAGATGAVLGWILNLLLEAWRVLRDNPSRPPVDMAPKASSFPKGREWRP